jgi:hypothetical protein
LRAYSVVALLTAADRKSAWRKTVEYAPENLGQRSNFLIIKLVDEVPADGLHVCGRRVLDGSSTIGGDLDYRSAGVVWGHGSGDESPPFHPPYQV